jgi:hypothetical protein
MATNLLKNARFEADWAEGGSHLCLLFPEDGEPEEAQRGNIFTPPGWITWFRDVPGTWGQPEVRDAWITGDPRRVHAGNKATLLFTFYRKHDAGFLQQVTVTPGSQLRLSAWAHAWSNHMDHSRPDAFPHPDDPRWSEGEDVGYNHFFSLEGDVTDEGARNFTFWVGIDPTGGRDPYASSVVWGRGAHIYNMYRPVPPVEAVAQGDTVTVFLRSQTVWAFKHNDAYWDTVKLVALGETIEVSMAFEPDEPRAAEPVRVIVTATGDLADVGLEVTGPAGTPVSVEAGAIPDPPDGSAWVWDFTPPREGTYRCVFTADNGAQTLAEGDVSVAPRQLEVWGLPRAEYARTYVLLPPGAGREWVEAVLDSGAWDDHRWTIGGSADDAGIGALENKTVIGVNPQAWPSDLGDFFEEYYPRVHYVAMQADSPAELRVALENLD